METQRHTPGPWIVGESSLGLIVGTDTGAICLLRDNYTHNMESNKANAKLIAAAPDLLKVCRIALVTLETVYENDKSNYAAKNDIDRLKKVIKEATTVE
jgi:hypothetical protein